MWSCLSFLTVSCTAIPSSENSAGGSDASYELCSTPINSWAYWLQDIQLEELIASPYDLLVIDYSRDGGENGRFTAGEIARLKQEGKHVLAYFSIGEAEDYRFYWKDGWEEGDPSFIGAENPEWPGNYKVKYWDDRWWDTALKPYLDRIIEAGFDGVYCDIVDGYVYWAEKTDDTAQETGDRMVELIVQIAEYGRKKSTGCFSVCIQNGLSILVDGSPAKVETLLETISCVGVESLFFNTSDADRRYRMKRLETVHNNGKPIFNVEYINRSKQNEYRELLKKASVPLLGFRSAPDRALDELPDSIYE